jgi:GNAT superfamily N-acetyltransferase
VTPPSAVVTATRADAAGVIALIGRVYAEYGFVWDATIEVPDLLDFDTRYGAPRGAFFVVRERGVVEGSVGVVRLVRETTEIHRLYLDERFRGRGTGRALMEAAIAWSRVEGASRVTLWSDTRFDRAHRLYTRLGFLRGPERVLPDDLNATREYFFARKV